GDLIQDGRMPGNADDRSDEDAEELVNAPIAAWKHEVLARIKEVRPKQSHRDIIESRVDQKIQELSRSCELSAVQTEKLKLAGRMEIKWQFDQIESGIRRLAQQTTPEEVNRVYEEVSPFLTAARRESINHAFRHDSFVHKVANSILSPEQLSQYRT